MRDYALETTFDLKFTTRAFATGAPTTLAGTPVISAYPGNSLTQLTAGITLTVDFDAVTGLHNVRVVATAANGYATNTNYALVITTGTVGGVSVVGEVIGEFSLEAQSPLRPTVTARTLDVSAAGEAGIDWANIGSPTTAQNLSGTNIDVDQVVASVSGAVGSVTGAVGSVTGAVGSVTGAVGSVTGLTASNLDATVSSRATPAQVNTEVVDGLNVDTYAESGQGTPAATASLAAKIGYLYKAWRNRSTQTSTTYSLYGDDAVTVDQKATVSDDGTTFDRTEVATGP